MNAYDEQLDPPYPYWDYVVNDMNKEEIREWERECKSRAQSYAQDLIEDGYCPW